MPFSALSSVGALPDHTFLAVRMRRPVRCAAVKSFVRGAPTSHCTQVSGSLDQYCCPFAQLRRMNNELFCAGARVSDSLNPCVEVSHWLNCPKAKRPLLRYLAKTLPLWDGSFPDHFLAYHPRIRLLRAVCFRSAKKVRPAGWYGTRVSGDGVALNAPGSLTLLAHPLVIR